MISYLELTQEQLRQYDELENETLPEGQFFWIENGEVFAASNNMYELWLAQGGDESSLIGD